MDPLSQGVLGATWSLNGVRKNKKSDIIQALALGCLSGMAPDLDVLIHSSQDPLLFLEFHRHFTHSLAFIPIGALICALVLRPLFALSKTPSLPWTRTYLYCFLGYASHALLDACTSYGTQLLWPFSNLRVAWDVISIIDPLYTIPILIFVVLCAVKKNIKWARFALVFSFLYIALGFFQHKRATDTHKELAQQRNHRIHRIHAKPSFANLILFRGIYETEDHFYVDAIRVPFWGSSRIYEGYQVAKFKYDDLKNLGIEPDSTVWNDVQRFEWFSDKFLVWHPTMPNIVSDLRYSMIPNDSEMLWGIPIDSNNPDKHVNYLTLRTIKPDTLDRFKNMLWGRDP